MKPSREDRMLAWLRERGPGPFTYRQAARGAGMTRGQAQVACLRLLGRGEVSYVQWIGDCGTGRFELKSVT